MFRKILLPLDLTDRHEPALEAAVRLARENDAEVILLHVIEVIPGLSREEEATFYRRLERMATAHLERWGATLAGRVAARGEVIFGNRMQEVVGYATRTGTDLIVLSSPSLDPENVAAGWGSLSYRIGILCSCPVLLVK